MVFNRYLGLVYVPSLTLNIFKVVLSLKRNIKGKENKYVKEFTFSLSGNSYVVLVTPVREVICPWFFELWPPRSITMEMP